MAVFDSTSKEVEWRDLELFIMGGKSKKFTRIKYKVPQDKEHLLAAGSDPIGVQSGHKKPSGELAILKGEFDLLETAVLAAGYEDILDAEFIIIVKYKQKGLRGLKIDTLLGVEFTEYELGMSVTSKFMEVPLPFLFRKRIRAGV